MCIPCGDFTRMLPSIIIPSIVIGLFVWIHFSGKNDKRAASPKICA